MNQPTTLMDEVRITFPDSYEHAHKRFLDQLSSISLPIQTCSFPLTSELTTEAAWLGPPDAERIVILISATHGVEGPVGTAVQLDTLTRLQRRPVLPPNTAMLMIFALNPYGFVMHRRCDGDGIDLNRNFVDFSEPLPENPGYIELVEAVYCNDPVSRQQLFDAYRRTHGETAYEIAISGGQYTDPHGPFYGGQTPGHGNRTVEQLIHHFDLEGRHLAVIDVHSGLGPYGHGEVISDHMPGTVGFSAAKKWYGAAATASADGTSTSVPKAGLLDYRWHKLMRERGCFITLEFGTYPIQNLFDVVLNDHLSWKSGDPESIKQSAAAMREHFCPADGYWRELILLKSRQVIEQAMKGLTDA